MCGIAGMLSLTSEPVARREWVRTMMDRLVHRGPDEAGEYRSPRGHVVLGHRRLRIIDLLSGQQPLTNEDGSVVVAFNGEIYDFLPLAAQLMDRGHRFASRSDTEVIVHLYEERGPACLADLNGMMALALWDDRAETLLLARDRIGKKPLYYTVADGMLLFASELDALAALPAVSREVDDLALDLCLTLGYIPAPYTIYRDVRKLAAGHALLVPAARPSELRQVRYDAAEAVREAPAMPASWNDAKQELIDRLRAATKARMVSDVPLGCFLSGGVDSSTVLSFMAELSPTPIKTFSIGFPEEGYSELPFARTIARHFGTDHHEYVLEPEGVGILDQLIEHFGEPFADSSALPTWYLSKLTRKSVTVALTGDGGDELFGGYDWYRTAQRLSAIRRWLPPGAARALARWRSPGAPRPLRRLAKAAAFAAYPDGWRFARQREIASPEVKERLYQADFLHRTGDGAWRWLADRHEAADGMDEPNRAMAADLATYMAEDLLVKVDRTSMAHALECRSPLLDRRVVEWAASVPASFKLSSQGGKRLLKAAVEDRFPPGFLNRRKQGFTVPLDRWFAADLQSVVRERVLHGPLARLGRFRMDGVGELIDEHFAGRANHASLVWALLVTGSWAARYA